MRSPIEGRSTNLDKDFTTKIFSTLQQIKTPSVFAYSAVDSFLPNPILYIPPHGTVGLPLSTDDAQKIISQASQSPFRKGEDTLIDTTVRKSWELNPNQFSLKNPTWNKAIEIILDSVIMGLGLKGLGKVSAELYKLLLYEPGAFFKPHKDSEKTAGMFATLVVCLPSQHDGGKLVLTHDNEKYEFETASSSSFGISYAAWYSDITHEVLPVVSGFRLMLTYNLIRQTDFKLPSHDLARGHVKQLSTLLEEYNSRLVEGDDKLPPILLHVLEHKYTQANLKLNTLKPPDLALVHTLSQLSTKLGFRIFLATLELRVRNEDEDNDDPDFIEREQSLKNLVELDGKLVEESLGYPDGALIDPTGQDEKKAEETEHEGYTGNQGSPVTYWYPNTVVVLVPPSKYLNFVLKFRSNGSVIGPLFCKLIQELSEDPAQKPRLEHLCELVLKPKLTEGYLDHYWYPREFSDSIPPYFQETVVTALDLGRIDLFDEACKTTYSKIILDNALILGRWAANKGVATMTDRLMSGVQIASPIVKKVEFLKAVAQGFKTAVPEPNSVERVSFKQWSDEIILSAVAELKYLTEADAISVAQLCRTIDWKQFESKTKPVVLKAIAMTKITFINELKSALKQELDEEQRLFIEGIIHSIWNQFVFDAKRHNSVPETSYWQQSKRNPVNKDDLNHIIGTTVTILFSECVETTIIPAMLTAIPNASKECAKELFISLVQLILKNKLAGFILPTTDTVPPPSHNRLFQALVIKFLHETVSPEPQAWTNSLPAGLCKCGDCSKVNRFLQDPRQRSFDLPCAQPRRKHLDQIFGCQPNYDITTIHGTSPNVWRITKHLRGYQTAKSEWEKTTKSAVQTLLVLKNEEPVDGRLEAYLQPYYSIIMNAKIKELPDLTSLITLPQSSETNENSASALNQETNQPGHKREASDIDLPEDGLAKRSKS